MRCFTVLGPSQSGKTTLTAALAALEGPGGAAPAPAAAAEGMAVTPFTYLGEDWAAFDIPGGADWLPQAARALAASDAAVLCLPPSPEAAPFAAPYLRLVEEAGVPCFLFVNRMDSPEGRVRDTVAALQAYASHILVLRQVPIRGADGQVTGAVDLVSERAWAYREGQPSALVEIPEGIRDVEQQARTELLEHLADFDDALLEELIEDHQPATDSLFALIADLHRHNTILPAHLGSALHRNGVTRLMKALRHETGGPDDLRARLGLGAEVHALAFAGDHRRHMGKTVLLRDLSGGLAQGAELGGAHLGSLAGLDGKPAGSLAPGGLGLAAKSDHLAPGTALTAAEARPLPEWSAGPPPALRRLILPAAERDEARLSAALSRLAETDPGLRLTQDAESGHAVATLQGPMHLRRLLDRLDAEFGIAAEARTPAGSYRETISARVDHQHRHRKQSGGAGQFADVRLTVEPLPRGEGFRFAETVKGGAVPRNHIPAVAAGAEDALARGPLGFPVIDVGVTLTDGKHHAVDSSDFAFRTAGAACLREALREARPVLLQPVDQVTIHVPSVYAGSLVALVSSLKGQVLGFDPHPTARGWDVFRALIPAPAHDELHQALGGLAHGTAWYESAFDHYEEIHGKEAERIRREHDDAAA